MVHVLTKLRARGIEKLRDSQQKIHNFKKYMKVSHYYLNNRVFIRKSLALLKRIKFRSENFKDPVEIIAIFKVSFKYSRILT